AQLRRRSPLQQQIESPTCTLVPGIGADTPKMEPTGVIPVTDTEQKGAAPMSLLKWALIMAIVSVIAAVLGFTDLSVASADVARILFYIFVVIFLVLLALGLMGARTVRGP